MKLIMIVLLKKGWRFSAVVFPIPDFKGGKTIALKSFRWNKLTGTYLS
jgi:hypothetical protein